MRSRTRGAVTSESSRVERQDVLGRPAERRHRRRGALHCDLKSGGAIDGVADAGRCVAELPMTLPPEVDLSRERQAQRHGIALEGLETPLEDLLRLAVHAPIVHVPTTAEG
jgi:hypothetical protein